MISRRSAWLVAGAVAALTAAALGAARRERKD